MTLRGFSFLALILAACSPPSPASGDGGGIDAGSKEAGIKAGGDSCNKIFTCIGNCSPNDEPCAQACYDKGSAGGKQKIDAFAQCLDKNQCMDPMCAKASCGPSLQACIDDVDAKTDGGAPVMQGNVPAELVGDWLSSNTTYHFDANGNYFMVGILVSKGPCIAFDHIDITNTGVASATGSQLTTTAATSKQDTTDCNGTKTSKTYPGDTKTYTWSINGTTLTMVGETGSIDYEKQ